MTLALQAQYPLSKLEQQTTWSEKVGPEYNKIESTKYWTTLHSDGTREFGHEAPAGGGWLSGLNDLPVPPVFVKGTITHRARFLFDMSIVDWQSGARIAVEFDNRVAHGASVAGVRPQANGSNQFNLSKGGMWQVDPGTGVWTDTGVQLSIAPLVWHEIAIEVAADFSAKTYGFNAVILDGVRSVPVKPMQNIPMLLLKWGEGANLQVQQVRQAAGVSILYVRDVGVVYIPE